MPRTAPRRPFPRFGALLATLASAPVVVASEPAVTLGFEGRIDYRCGEEPVGVALADLGANGLTDLVTLNGDGSITVLDLDARGRVHQRFDHRLAGRPEDVAFADYDGDGVTDLALVTSEPNRVVGLRSRGDDGLSPLFSADLAGNPASILSLDLDSDPYADLAVTTFEPPRLLLYRGGPRGELDSALSIDLSFFPGPMTKLDLEGEGAGELMIAESSRPRLFRVRLPGENRSLAVEEISIPLSCSSLAVGDLDGDGVSDLVLGGGIVASVGMMMGQSDGSFSPRPLFDLDVLPDKVALPDLNRDGKADLVVVNRRPASEPPYALTSYLSTEGGHFEKAGVFEVAELPSGLAVGDVDGDGRTDVVVGSQFGNSVSLFASTGDGSFRAHRRLPHFRRDARRPRTVDLDGDGLKDLVFAGLQGSEIVVYRGTEGGTFDGPYVTDTVNFVDRVTIADLNGDRVPDVVASSFASSKISLHWGNGDGGFFEPRGQLPMPRGLIDLRLADVVGGPALDLLSLHLFSSQIVIREGSGNGEFGRETVLQSHLTEPYALRTGDLDRDGRTDLVVMSYSLASVEIFVASEGGGFQAPYPFEIGERPADLVLADVNRDGWIDLCAANSLSRQVTVLPGRGGALFGSPRVLEVGDEPVAIEAADFLRRGVDDLAVLYPSGTVGIHLSQGDGTFRKPLYFGVGSGDTTFLADDLDGDTLPDLVTSTTLLKNRSYPPEVTALFGTVNAGSGDPSPVLSVNSDTGGLAGEVWARIGEPLMIVLSNPPAAQAPVPYVLYLSPGLPNPGPPLPRRIGRPAFAFPFQDGGGGGAVQVLANGFSGHRFERLGGDPMLSRRLAPDFFLTRNVDRAATFTVQGLVIDPASASVTGVSLTNGVVLRIE